MKRTKALAVEPKKARKPRNIEVRKLVFRLLANPEINARDNVLAMQMHVEWILSGKVPPIKNKDKPKLASANAP